jgi:hypothetical protein
MGLKDVLVRHKIPVPADFDERMDIVISGLRRKGSYKAKLQNYKKHRGGAADEIPIPIKPMKDDFLGPRLKWIVEVMGSPYAQGLVRILFMVIFFASYLESIPIFGSILSVSLDVMVASTKMLTKTIQKNIPPILGLLPVPYAALVGMGIASLFGAILWPVIAIVSFSRQDFVAAIDSFIRVVPPPFGDTIADLFLETNRMVYRIDEKRVKLAGDISAGISLISGFAKDISSEFSKGATSLSEKTKVAAVSGIRTVKEIAEEPPKIPSIQQASDILKEEPPVAAPPPQAAGKRNRLSRRMQRKNKWRTARNRSGSLYANGSR